MVRARATILLGLTLATAVAALGLADGCNREPPAVVVPDGAFSVSVLESYYPWWGWIRPGGFQVSPGQSWAAEFDLSVDLTRLAEYPGVIDRLTVALVGEPTYDAAGTPTGLSAITLTSSFTSTGVPLSYYEGTLPVRALGSIRGSPFEAVADFPADGWEEGGTARLTGTLSTDLPADTPHGLYRPHLEVFAHIAGSNTPVDLGHLPYQLGQWLETNLDLAGPAGRHASVTQLYAPEPMEFMRCPQVLPEVRVGEPSTPRIPWTVFHGSQAYGQSGLLPVEEAGRLGLVNRVRFPTPMMLLPGTYTVHPSIPTLYPEQGLAGLFIGGETVTPTLPHFMDLYRGAADARLTGPDGKTVDLGRRGLQGETDEGPRLDQGGFDLDLSRTGSYRLELTGTMYDTVGRSYEAGGTYEFSVAYPLSFSTPVKPGTNFIEGARYPATAHVNPPQPAEVTISVTYLPNSDPDRAEHAEYSGVANRYGHFRAAGPPLAMPEPGEYRSLVVARYEDADGNLWMGSQASAGVVAEREPSLVLHGGRTYISPPHPDKPDYGGFDRYQLDFEGGSSYLDEELLSQFDHVFPYYSGDTLHVATTYPFESVVGIVLSMEARERSLATRLAQVYNPSGEPFNYPTTPRWRKPSLLPDVVKLGEDNFGYYRVSADHADHLPILSATGGGLSPQAFTDDLRLEAYTYLSVVRPGFLVLGLAYTGSFMGPCWIVSPNPYGGQINASPNGDLPGDVYRVMAGLVVKDLETGENHYDAYAAAISALPPGSYASSVTAPGTRPLLTMNGREFPFYLGLDTSDVFVVGEDMMLGGTVMPPTSAHVILTVVRPDGVEEVLDGWSNRLGGFPPPRPIPVDLPGAYRVRAHIELDGVGGDIPGTGDGEFYHFAIREDDPEFVRVEVAAITRVEHGMPLEIPLRWDARYHDARVTYSVMMPGNVLDEGVLPARSGGLDFTFDPVEAAIQYPFIDTVDYATGEPVYGDTIVLTFLIEATVDGGQVFDAVRVILRGNRLFNPRGSTRSPRGAGHPGSGHPGPGHPGTGPPPPGHPKPGARY